MPGIANGGQLPSLLVAIQERETQRDHLRQELRLLDRPSTTSDFDPRVIEKEVCSRLTDWQGLLRREPQHSRQILKKLLLGKLVFTPKTNETGRFYEFAGKGTLTEILAGTTCTKGLVSPGGPNRAWTFEIAGLTFTA
jgi:hypothetical protein